MKGKAKISIQALERFGPSGWEWLQVFSPPYPPYDTEEGEIVQACRTSPHGDGLFFYNSTSGMYHQQLGTCQFSLSKDRRNAYQQIRRHILKEWFE